jgi:hypothetical protein
MLKFPFNLKTLGKNRLTLLNITLIQNTKYKIVEHNTSLYSNFPYEDNFERAALFKKIRIDFEPKAPYLWPVRLDKLYQKNSGI